LRQPDCVDPTLGHGRGGAERYALTTAYDVPLLWYNRIIVHDKAIRGWHFTPSHYVQEDLVEVWLAR
jgi:peptide/nickel transport system substrate-binding protein